MPVALLSSSLYVDGWDATGDSKSIALSADRTVHDRTTFRSGRWRECTLGGRSGQLAYNGWWNDATVDPEAFPTIGVQRVLTACPVETEGAVAHMLLGKHFGYEPFPGTYDTLAPFSLLAQGSDGQGIVRGSLVKALGTVSATGATGAEVQLGAASASQFLYATFHVFSVGTTITAVLESDSDDTFASATTRVTFGPTTTVGGTWATRVAGAITDTWYRLRITAVTGTFSIGCAAAIQ